MVESAGLSQNANVNQAPGDRPIFWGGSDAMIGKGEASLLRRPCVSPAAKMFKFHLLCPNPTMRPRPVIRRASRY